MGITRAVIGAVAAAGVARLLAPKETKQVMKSAKRAVSAGAISVKRKAASMAKPAKASAKRAVSRAASKAKAATRKVTKASSKARKAPRRSKARKAAR